MVDLDLGVWANLFAELGLKPTFSTWSQVTMLHMYLLSARFRCFDAHIAQPWQQHLLDHFFYDAENRMTIEHNMHARGTRNKYLKDLFIQWRGVLAAYDEGLARGDAVLAAAVWRNVFKAKEDVDVRAIAQIVSYMRRVLKGLDKTSDEDVHSCKVEFGSPVDEAAVVALKSKMMDTPFEATPSKAALGNKQA
jgi:cytochrome b pre-mRNA-processing protein 3